MNKKSTIESIYCEKLWKEKDRLHTIINSMKKSWTRETWILLHELAREQNYLEMFRVIKRQRDSKTQKKALELIAEIIRLSAKLKFAF